jgi:hypothetical protein
MTDHRRRPAALLALIAALVLAAPSVAWAQQSVTPEQAARVESLATEANKLRKQGRYDEAIAKLKEAAGIYSAPWLLYNLGRTYEEAGDLSLARAHYELCVGPNVDAAVKKRATDGLARIRKAMRPGFLVVRVEPKGATLIVDGGVVARAPGEAMELSPGTHRIRLEAAGRAPHEQDLRIEPGSTKTVEVRLRARNVAAPPPVAAPAATAPVQQEEAESSGGVSPVAWVLLAAGAGLAGGGAWMYTDGSSKWDEVNNSQAVALGNEQVRNMTETRAQQLIDAGKTRHTIGLALIGAGIASVAGSVTMFVLGSGGGEEAAARGFAPPALLVSPHPYGGSLTVTGGF